MKFSIMNLFIFLILSCFKFNSAGVVDGFGPFYATTLSVEECDIGSTYDKNNSIITRIKVLKTSRTEETYLGNLTVTNDVQIVKAVVILQKLQDGGFRNEFKKVINNPCKSLGLSVMLSIMKADINCNIKKGVYKTEGLNPNMILHHLFQSYHYNRYTLLFEWHSKAGSLGCFGTMLEFKPLRNKTQHH